MDTVLFDLDGTLVDTLDDIVRTVNAALRAHGLPALSPAEAADRVGEGGTALVEASARKHGRPVPPGLVARVQEAYLTGYAASPAEGSRPYPGAEALLERLRAAGVRTALCTNKARRRHRRTAPGPAPRRPLRRGRHRGRPGRAQTVTRTPAPRAGFGGRYGRAHGRRQPPRPGRRPRRRHARGLGELRVRPPGTRPGPRPGGGPPRRTGDHRTHRTHPVPRDPMTEPRLSLREGTMSGSPADDILRLVFSFRRLAHEPAGGCAAGTCEECFALHRPKVERFIEQGVPLHFVIPAFPAKSPNPEKVLGTLPDMAERVSLEFLQGLCDYTRHYHEPGARITICSDGHVFSDLVGVPDEVVQAYGTELDALLRAIGADSINTYGLHDAFPGLPYEEQRAALTDRYAVPVEDVRARALADPAARSIFGGIHRFLFEDRMALSTGRSRNSVREETKSLAYRVIQRSDAWSSLVEDFFPEALRLSIHPQVSHSPKIGIHLMRTRDNWLTPWHGVALDDGEEVRLVKRHEAERLGATLVMRGGRVSHYIAPDVPSSFKPLIEEVAS
ncbi:L-tyrosine/L-tryptophan isonitrile synthase family protein [Streptomyces somaliensis]|nr:L-tyrosine/L-tryptophan isonitrile synthase family protein [Streptomyces somaliensis]